MSTLTDNAWVKQAFMVSPKMTTQGSLNRKIANSAQFKFTDTTIGGNRYINSTTQFTSNADPKENPYGASKGYGRFSSESQDDNAIIAHMRFGVAEFNSLGNFFTNFFTPALSHLTKTGEAPGWLFFAAKATTVVMTIGYQALVYTARQVGGFVRYLMNKPYTKYYYLKPTMPIYWNAVNTIVKTIGVNKGILVPATYEGNDSATYGKEATSQSISKKELDTYASLLPDIFGMGKDGSTFDVYAMANRAQRLSDIRLTHLRERAIAAKTREEYTQALMGVDANGDLLKFNTSEITAAQQSLPQYIKKYQEVPGRYSETKQVPTKDADGKEVQVQQEIVALPEQSQGYLSELSTYLTANRRDGSDWVSFKIEPERTVSESFTNTVGESEIAGKLKGMVSQNNNLSFSFARGNIGGPVGAIIEGASDFISGVASGLKIEGLLGLAGGAFPDIPQHWQESSASLPTSQFTIKLRAPYGHPMCTFLKEDIPLAMLLAGALPLSTGNQSYTSPFLVEYYCKSRSQTRLGIISSLEITRGTGSHGWTVDQNCRGIDVSVTITDMSSVMHMPISESFDFVGDVLLQNVFRDDSAFTDYMAVLGGLNFDTQVYPLQRMARNRFISLQKWNDWKSPSHLASWISGTPPGRLMSALSNNRFNANDI